MKVICPPYNHDCKHNGWGVIWSGSFQSFWMVDSGHFWHSGENEPPGHLLYEINETKGWF